MESTLGAGTSGVTVEYTDPSGIFTDIEPLLKSRLPLRNLHWKSPTRPLRSIESLHVSLVQGNQKRPTSDPTGGATKQRRHQIPGLRQTPYLKIYLLRCDDNETYKTTSRKLIREWLKENTPSSQNSSSTNNQENHDAFEWLIVQVVYPDTPAANLSRSSSTASAAKASNEKLGSTKWPGRGSSTVFEKIKADFNGSSKSSPDRVAQIRVPRPSSQPQSRPAGVELREHDDHWGDLTDKLKSLILTSFDLRVSQYEEDIREKDAQRNLPGWNFCTFFILKEGLARGFENVGLFEDALIGYDELAIGLDVIVRDQGDGSENATGGTFLSYSESLRKDLLDKLNNESTVENGSSENPITLKIMQHEYPLNVDQKPYRELILASNISIFDVRVYIFARQLTLLLKAADATSLLTAHDDSATASPSASLGKEYDTEDLLTLAEACRRATDFISIGARNLRNDLESGFYEFHSPSDTGSRFLQTVTQTIDNMVKSWTFGVALQVLEQTATKGLSIPASALLNRNGSNGSGTDKTSQSTSESLNRHTSMPARKGSLPSNTSQIQRRPSSEMFSPDLETTSSTLHDIGRPGGPQQPETHTNSRTGSEDLASWRAEVFLLARGVLQGLAKKRDWPINCTGLETLHSIDELREVSLDGHSPSEPESEHEHLSNSLVSSGGLTLDLLRQIASTIGNLKTVYELLTDLALRHFIAANRSRSAERLFADMGVLKFRSDDFASAASYFHQVAPFYGAAHWSLLEGTTLELYARCLKKLDRTEEYVHVLLGLLPKYVMSRDLPGLPSCSRYPVGDVDSQAAGDAPDLVSGYVDDLFVFSKELGKGIPVSLEDLFGGLEIEPRIWHCEKKDGFQIHFKMHSLLGNEIPLQNIRVRLLESAEISPREIWLENDQDVVVKAEQSTIVVETNISVRGKYTIDRIEARSDNILFRHDELSQALLPREFRDTPAFDIANLDKPLSVSCYPCSNGLQLQVRPPTRIFLAESRFFEVEIRTGWNRISMGELSIRSGTAGLRIRLLDAEFLGGNSKVTSSPQPSTIQFSSLEADSLTRLKIPYTLEDDVNSLNFKLDLQYTTNDGVFRHIANTSLPSILPVSVNVQDMFRDTSLFSRFTIVPATLVPLRVLGCRIDDCDTYEVIPAVSEAVVMDIFPRQPASLLYKFVRRNHHLEPPEKPLAFTMSFRCLDEEALGIIEERFAQDIMNSEFNMFRQLLIPQILAKFRVSMTASDLETIGLVRELQLPSYEEVGWDATLLGLGRNVLTRLKEWLKEWQKTNAVLPLPEVGENGPSLDRQIVIPVDIPQIKVVHTAELRILGSDDRQPLAAVGQPLVAELRIKHTHNWGGRESDGASNPTGSENEGQSMEFSYEIHANPEVWLIGGKRRGNFQARENEVNTFPIMLLPQRHGHLLLPGLDIKALELQASPSGAQKDSTAPPPRKQVQSELDYRNHGESILVLPDLKTTTVSLDPGGPGGGSWLVESERRIELAKA